ncbi:hypothetical protein BDF21DRAFT_407819 [Thamnidium elegans]|nr:hypothetical protein BDF21DRAFT_407819 [Thamnidium elegans]
MLYTSFKRPLYLLIFFKDITVKKKQCFMDDKITCYCNNIEPKSHLNLQDIWTIEVAKFSCEYPKVKHLDNMKLKQNVIDTRSAFVNQVVDQANENVFSASTDLVPISNIINLNKLDAEKKKLKHVDDVHKQDLLYYSKDTEEKMKRVFEASDNEYILSQSDFETSTLLQSPKKKLRH